MTIAIPVPEKAKILVKNGQEIEIGTALFEHNSFRETKVFVSKKLDIPSHTIFKHLKKFVGDEIKKGDILAEKKTLFASRAYKSEFDGVIKEINHTDGAILIAVSTEESQRFLSYVKGEVVETQKGRIEIRLVKAVEYEAKEIRGTAGGRIIYILNEQHGVFEEEMEGSVVFAEKLTTYNQAKMEALGVAGLVLARQPVEPSSIPFGVLKTIASHEAILKAQSPYCFIDEKQCRIVFYG